MIRKQIHKKDKENKNSKFYLNGYPIKEYLPVLFFFSIIVAISIILCSTEHPNFLLEASAIYLLIVFFLYYHSNMSDIESKDREITQLKRENKQLKTKLEAYKTEENNTTKGWCK